jgi:hypothetical protein
MLYSYAEYVVFAEAYDISDKPANKSLQPTAKGGG